MKQSIIEFLQNRLNLQNIILERPKSVDFGHFAFPVFNLAKEQRKNPNQIAIELCEALANPDMFDEVVAVGGFVNFKLSSKFLDSFANNAMKSFDTGMSAKKKEKILLEFVSANPTGPLHIGHARGAIYGDALLQIGRYLGHDIDSEYYINDAGKQVYLLGLSIYLRVKEAVLNESVEWPESFYRGEYIYELADEAYAYFGASKFVDESAILELAWWGKDKMMVEVKSNLALVDISFDKFVSEKEIFANWRESQKVLEAKNALYTDEDNKVWLRTTEYGDEKDRVVVRENGEPTYLAGDITYHGDKFARGYDRYINIWGADHHGYISRVKAAVSFLGYDSSKLEVLLSQMVALLKDGEPYKMSKRAGNFILMKDVVEDIGSDALRFVFLSKKSDTHLEFDVEDLKKEDSTNPIFYINYAHARINSLFEKAGRSVEEVVKIELKDLDADEKELLFSALLLPSVLEDAFDTRDVQKVTEYLKLLAAKFHKFYNEHKIVESERETVYLKLFAVTALSIRTALKILGINAKYKM
jgi:arginyl-tRNA synthetase